MSTPSKFISYLFHPLLMPTYGIWLVFNLNSYIAFVTPYEYKRAVYLITFISTFLLPAFSSFLLWNGGYIKSLKMETLEERRLPFLFTCTSFVLGYYFLNSLMQLPQPVRLMLIGVNTSLIIALIISIKWKISAHMIGVGGIVGAVIGLSYRLMVDFRLEIAWLILIAGAIGYARLVLKAHTPAQVYSGFLLGALTEVFLLVFF